ncbi:glycoside hydrolase family 15 protein [Acidianus sulfidivorans JP7]|uniref:Glycoside hydrolase family 15 protein n=1 Tax=Acidianus sulfidivorans JP7 TaxID=619593 RepID=A0A2U9ILR8_9CREN|nr:alpha,alpha-trehalase TreH1 [Acidianus sulfidivorans]AWR96962.1 glycoside hydrolase family 15 protein [Acidianus sulfidivorans JP7]
MKSLPCINNEFTGALIDGTKIVWLPFPRYDSSPIFAYLLDENKGGFFDISGEVVKQEYVVPNVLLTTLKDGSEITDSLLRGEHSLIRKIIAKSPLTVNIYPTFNYGKNKAVVEQLSKNVYKFSNVESSEFLEVHFVFNNIERLSSNSWKIIGEGYIYLGYFQDERFGIYGKNIVTFDPSRGLERTINYWKNEMKRGRSKGKLLNLDMPGLNGEEILDAYQNSVGILLGLLYNPTGAVVAAPTTSLPEIEGGSRNWDYRFAWVRDSAIIADALISAGFSNEARRIIEFLSRMVSFTTKPFMYPLYCVDGSVPPKEIEIPWLSGYANSKPIRVGNAAAAQLQLDLEGFFLDAMYKYYRATGDENYIRAHLDVIQYIADWVSENWKLKDVGIWEERGVSEDFIHSKVMMWVALERAGKLVNAIDEENRWKDARHELKEWILNNGVVDGKFVKRPGSNEVDASLLAIPIYGFVEPDDPIFLNTLKEIESTLTVNGLVKRYKKDFLGEAKYPFTLTSLWLARVYSMLGRFDDAKKIIAYIIKISRPFYLVGEHINPEKGEFTGNYPQAFAQANLILALDDLADAIENKKKEEEKEKSEEKRKE